MEIAELIIAKFCHELAGNVSIIYNGLEIAKQKPHSNFDLDLVSESSAEIFAKLIFYRFCYGNQNTRFTHVSDLMDITNKFYNCKSTVINWGEGFQDLLLTLNLQRLLANCLILLFELSSAKHATIDHHLTKDGGLFTMQAHSTKSISIPYSQSPINFENLQHYLVLHYAEESQATVNIQIITNNILEITVKYSIIKQ